MNQHLTQQEQIDRREVALGILYLVAEWLHDRGQHETAEQMLKEFMELKDRGKAA